MLILNNMNYQALKTMIESILNSYKCAECGSSVTADNIDIMWAAWNNVNIDIECPKCKKHAMVKSQIMQMNVNNIEQLKENLDKIKGSLLNLNTWIKSELIKDKDIIDLSKDLKNKNIEAWDLFN